MDLYALPGIDGLVFPSGDGQPMRRSNFRRRVWEPATAQVGLTGFRFHDLRHTAATLAAASGTSLKALMARIGHASAAVALRYQHVSTARTPTSSATSSASARSRPCPPEPTTTPRCRILVGTQWARRPVDHPVPGTPKP